MTECEEHEWVTSKNTDGVLCFTCAKPQTIQDVEVDAFVTGFHVGRKDGLNHTLKVAKRIAHELITDEALRATYIETLVTQLYRKDRHKPYCPICEELHDFPARCWADKQDEEIHNGK